MDLAIRKAKEVGIAWVNCTGERAKEALLLRWSAVCVGMMCRQRRVFS